MLGYRFHLESSYVGDKFWWEGFFLAEFGLKLEEINMK